MPIIASPDSAPNFLVIDGNGKPVYLTNVDGWDTIILQNAPGTIIENLIYTDGTTILVIRSDNLIIRNNTIINAKSYALFAEFCNNVEIYNNTIKGGTNDGIISYGNDNVIIYNNHVSGVIKNGIFAKGNNVSISNNEISDIAGTGIYIEDTTDLTVVNNSISNVDWSPIAPDQASFNEGSFSGNTYNGIPLTNDDINPAISNTISISTSSQLTYGSNGSEDIGISSTAETKSPWLIMSIGIMFVSIYMKFKRSKRIY